MKIGVAGYYWLDTWILANVIQLATQDFCRAFLTLQNDPCGRQFDQMTQAARSCTANIAEGNSRHYTSRETEMKLTDVARASLSELANDYINWLLQSDNTRTSRWRSSYPPLPRRAALPKRLLLNASSSVLLTASPQTLRNVPFAANRC